jgi:hypothetical protein
MYARTNRWYNEWGSRTNHVRSSVPHYIYIYIYIIHKWILLFWDYVMGWSLKAFREHTASMFRVEVLLFCYNHANVSWLQNVTERVNWTCLLPATITAALLWAVSVGVAVDMHVLRRYVRTSSDIRNSVLWQTTWHIWWVPGQARPKLVTPDDDHRQIPYVAAWGCSTLFGMDMSVVVFVYVGNWTAFFLSAVSFLSELSGLASLNKQGKTALFKSVE